MPSPSASALNCGLLHGANEGFTMLIADLLPPCQVLRDGSTGEHICCQSRVAAIGLIEQGTGYVGAPRHQGFARFACCSLARVTDFIFFKVSPVCPWRGPSANRTSIRRRSQAFSPARASAACWPLRTSPWRQAKGRCRVVATIESRKPGKRASRSARRRVTRRLVPSGRTWTTPASRSLAR